jgi:hypothetical protein
MRTAACVLCIAASAHADDGLALHAVRRDAEPAPQLELDPILSSRFETLHADEDTHAARIPLGPHLTAQLETTAWSNLDITEHGWSSVARLAADRGPWHASALVSWNGVDGWLGGGRYTDVGVALARTFHLSRWMTAWIALSISQRQWSGSPPPGERSGTTVMLSIGTTFR